MFSYLAFGSTLAFAAAVQPGPFQAYLVAQTMRAGWKRTLPAAIAPVLTDGPIILLVLFILQQLPSRFAPALQIVGGLFLLFLACSSARTWRRFEEVRTVAPPSGQRTLFDAAVVNLLNPNPYLTWSLILGPLLLKGWREAPSHGVALLAGFYGTLTVMTAAIITLLAGAKRLGPRVSRALVLLSAFGLLAFGMWQLWAGVWAILA